MTYDETMKLAKETISRVNVQIKVITGGAMITSVKDLVKLEKQACKDLNITMKQYNGLQRFYSGY